MIADLCWGSDHGPSAFFGICNRLPRDICVFFEKSRGTVRENSRGKVGLMAVSNRLPRDICV